MTKARLVRVTTQIIFQGSRATALWIVGTGDPAEAVRIVRGRVAPECDVEITDHEVQPETIKRLGLVAGQAWHL
jgi:hypothetical protein